MKSTITICLLALTSLAHAQKVDSSDLIRKNPRDFSVGLSVFPYFQKNTEESGPDALAFYTSFSWRIRKRVTTGVRPFYVQSRDYSNASPTKYYGVSFYYRYDFYKREEVNLFLDAGAGFAAVRSKRTAFNGEEYSNKDLAFIANVGLGAEYKISDKWSVELLVQYVKWNYDLSSNLASGIMPTIGIKYRIN